MVSEASTALDAAYLATHYRVRGGSLKNDTVFTFDDPAGTDEAPSLPFGAPWTIITAWNPMSKPCAPSENHAAQARLLDAVRALHCPFLPAEGADASAPPRWVEESILVERIDQEAVVQLLRVFRQRAAVFGSRDRAGLLYADPVRWEIHPVRIISAPARAAATS